jgi:hypothetical protein
MHKKPQNYRTILRWNSDAKTSKGFDKGYLTGIIYLAPHTTAKIVTNPQDVLTGLLPKYLNLCPMAGNCKLACLYTAGRGAMKGTQARRIAKTVFFAHHREAFLDSLRWDIRKLIRTAAKLGKVPAVRINGTSDLPQLALQMAREFPQVQFYDYTKIPRPWERTLPNYHLTFSHDGAANLPACLDVLAHGVNVAVVFSTRKGQPLPATWMGYRVIDGDLSDLRFRDAQGVIVGVRAKGAAKRIRNGFVQEAA